ncbi:sensor histidine kinase [Nocardia panacis]|uniref:histidine kinase n=1 Tax=Nocardia panacis TaxID=2340916 RepID=A0A3A4KGB1_9NOCA|nr:sensor histidine kinase [Nocardia panacis]RJO75008.1 sensor histidine kinase [Nocardia panacis]
MTKRRARKKAEREAARIAKETERLRAEERRKARPGLFRRLGTQRNFDIFTVFASTVLFIVAWATLHVTHDVPAAVQPFFGALAALPVLLVRVNPALGWAISAGAALVIKLAVPNTPGNELPFQVVHIIALFVLLFAVGVRAAPRIVGLIWVATSLLMGAAMSGTAAWTWPIALAAVVLFGLMIRWLIHSRRQLQRQEEENEVERARRTILEEKARIARDLHDVVAHHMSLVVVQAQTAPYRVEGVTPAARAEFESIGATAREALNEIRGMLGVLRSDGQMPEHTPQPKATDVLGLFDGAKRAGVEITWAVDGPLDAVPDTAGLAVYRIVQESLSNASRHAPGAAVHVHIVVAPDLLLTVINGPGATPAKLIGNGGHGLAGMRARAVAVGGEVTATPRPDGGFEVRARLPLHLSAEAVLAATAAGD